MLNTDPTEATMELWLLLEEEPGSIYAGKELKSSGRALIPFLHCGKSTLITPQVKKKKKIKLNIDILFRDTQANT